jgi:tetratricopeptide (TPR) repeat protein
LAEDRNSLEQKAIGHLGKENSEEALKCYQAILRMEPRDIRIRQKIGDLYIKLGRTVEATRQFREVAIGHIAEDQFRQALVVLKNLQKLKPKDDEVYGLLGDCYKACGFLPDAREAYEKVIEMLEHTPKEGLPFAVKLMAISPGEMGPKINHAQLLQRCGKLKEAAGAWRKLGQESRRRGNAADQANFYERALRLDDGDSVSLEGGAEARIALGEPKEALVHIQKAYAENPSSAQVLSMLAQCFELMDQHPKAKKVLLQLAKIYQELNDPVGQRDALGRAFVCDPEDAGLESQVGDAAARAERCEMRLTDHKWSEPEGEAQAQVVVEAAVLAKYGLADKAKSVLEAAPDDVRISLSARAQMVEVLVILEDSAGALEELAALETGAGDAQNVVEQVQCRAAALRGEFDVLVGGPVGSEAEPEEGVEIDLEDEGAGTVAESGDPEAQGDALAAAGDIQGAMMAYQRALAADPTNEEVLMKLGEIVAGGDDSDEPESETVASAPEVNETSANADMPDFGNILQGGAPARPAAPVAPVAVSAGADVHVQARSRILVGLYAEAVALVEGQTDLLSAVLCGEARIYLGEANVGRKALRRVLDECAETDAGYTEALWVLSRLQVLAGKRKAAGRTLNDLEDIEESYRAVEVHALRAGLALLQGQ